MTGLPLNTMNFVPHPGFATGDGVTSRRQEFKFTIPIPVSGLV